MNLLEQLQKLEALGAPLTITSSYVFLTFPDGSTTWVHDYETTQRVQALFIGWAHETLRSKRYFPEVLWVLHEPPHPYPVIRLLDGAFDIEYKGETLLEAYLAAITAVFEGERE